MHRLLQHRCCAIVITPCRCQACELDRGAGDHGGRLQALLHLPGPFEVLLGLVGPVEHHEAGWFTSGGHRETLIQFTGTVAGCGSGTMLIEMGSTYDGANPDWQPGDTVRADNTWHTVEGFGTGDLADAVGAGSGTSEDSATTGNVSLTGSIDCDSG